MAGRAGLSQAAAPSPPPRRPPPEPRHALTPRRASRPARATPPHLSRRNAPGDPGAAHLFGPAVYQRGGMTVYALRKTIGDNAIRRLLTTWTAGHKDGNATTEDLINAAEQVSGKNLGAFFQAWLYSTTKPPRP
ncbi:MAG: M1 family aminopeptidase [Catenulispora sp.]